MTSSARAFSIMNTLLPEQIVYPEQTWHTSYDFTHTSTLDLLHMNHMKYVDVWMKSIY